MSKLNDNPTKTNAKLTNATEKMRKASTKRDTAVSKEKTVMSNLATKASAHKKIKKELLDTKKELANAKEDIENHKRQLQQADSRPSRGDFFEHYLEKERIKRAAFEEKTAISHRNTIKEEQCKTDAKQDNVSTIQAMSNRDNPFGAKGRHSSSRECRRDQGRCLCP
jgi:hypothetical protein